MLIRGTRFVVLQVKAVGGLEPDEQLADELSDSSIEGKRQVLTSGTERDPHPFTWQKGDQTLTA